MESLQLTNNRALRIALGGVILAFAWLVMSIVLGLGAGHAHADDADERGGLLSGVTNTAGSLVTSVTDAVADTAATATTLVSDATVSATGAATPVVEELASVAPDLPVAPVVDVVESVTDAVTEVTGGGVVTPIVTPVVDLVTAVPVVGSVVSDLKLDAAVTTLSTSVDNTLHGTSTALDDAVQGVADVAPGSGVTLPVVPILPPAAIDESAAWMVASPVYSAGAVVTPPSGSLAALHALSTSGRSGTSLVHAASALAATAVTAIAVTVGGAWDGAWDGAGMILGSFMPANSALSAPGGAGPGAWVLVAFGLFIAYRAWMRRSGLSNDTAPAAPAFSTDVSPD